jgi:pimeloyl-ACP methyl ester carboxylesterase
MKRSGIHVITVPCFSGAPWDLKSFPGLAKAYRTITLALPDGVDTVEANAAVVTAQVDRYPEVVLVGDSFGAFVALAVALRHPLSLRGLVLSGGFASDPNTSLIGRMRAWFARTLPRVLYKGVTLRAHAAALASPHDDNAEVPWSKKKSRQLFAENTPWESYIGRLRAIHGADYGARLAGIDVPTLILSPSFDKLVGREATDTLRDGIRGAEEVVLKNTGHMFRFTHPHRYEEAVSHFIETRVAQPRNNATAIAPDLWQTRPQISRAIRAGGPGFVQRMGKSRFSPS